MHPTIGKVSPNRTTILVAIILFLGTAALFWPVGKFDFVGYDDPSYVTQNSHVNTGLSGENIAWAFGNVASEATYWHPISWMSHMLDCQLFGLNAGAHHYMSVFFHALNALLVFLVVLRFTGATWRSAAVAALFAWHPLQVESVAWVTERKNLLSTMFLLLTLLAYKRFVSKTEAIGDKSKSSSLSQAVARISTPHYILVVGLFALGLMSKPMLVTLPCVLLLLDFWPLKRTTSDDSEESFAKPTMASLFLEKVPLLILSAISSAITILAHQKLQIVVASQQVPFSIRLANAALSYVKYLERTIWPVDLIAIYPYPKVWPISQSILCGVVLLLITIVVLKLRKTHRVFLFAWLWFLGTLVPVIGLLQVGAQAMADRFAYVPLIGIFIAAVWAAGELLSKVSAQKIVAAAVTPVVLITCLVASRNQLGYWRDSQALFQRAIAVNPENPIAHYNLGLALFSVPGKLEEAKQHFRDAIRINPAYIDARNNLAGVLYQEGRYAEALVEYEKILETDPNHALARFNAGLVYERGEHFDVALDEFEKLIKAHPDNIEGWMKCASLMQRTRRDEVDGKIAAMLQANPKVPEAHIAAANFYMAQEKQAEALKAYMDALALRPGDAPTHFNVANLLGMMGRTSEALAHLKEAARLKPDFTQAHFTLAMACASQGKIEEALENYRNAIKADKTFVPALVSLSWILASHQSEKIRNGSEAVDLAGRAVQLTGGKDAIALDTLAAAYAETGKFSHAVETAEKAVALMQNGAPQDQLEQVRNRLDLYKKQQRYHGL